MMERIPQASHCQAQCTRPSLGNCKNGDQGDRLLDMKWLHRECIYIYVPCVTHVSPKLAHMTCVYIHTCVFAMCVCMYIYTHACVCLECMQVHQYVCMFIHMYANICIHIHVFFFSEARSRLTLISIASNCSWSRA